MSDKPPRFIFLDLETTGLDAGVDQITEAAWIFEHPDGTIRERQAFVEHNRLPNEWVLAKSDYLTRILPARKMTISQVLNALASDCYTLCPFGDKPYLVGACPAFDDRFLRVAYGAREFDPTEVPYHYHVIDIEAMAMGACGLPSPPTLSKVRAALGIPGANDAPHTALADAREAKLIFDTIRSAAVEPIE